MGSQLLRKKIGEKYYLNNQEFSTGKIKVVETTEYRTKGEDFILIRGVEQCKLILDSTTTSHIVIKTMTNSVIKPFIGMIDEEYDEVRIGKGACVEFILIENNYYIVSSDGLKIE
ncbi:hypothetical protein N9P74_00455 [bacterium]|nr:hypothetical protein [bacterium]MDB0072960.1 hypothetical protein [bacterium]MDB4235100.1 hypothetical protein [bacterium]MDB4352939.1 hypothetical protein [Porticoccaceae bacterium]